MAADWLGGEQSWDEVKRRHEGGEHWNHLAQVVVDDQLTGGTGAMTGIPAVYRAVQMTVDLVASLPLRALRHDIEVTLPHSETPSVLIKPDPSITYHQFVAQLMSSLVMRGNAYLLISALDRYDHALAYRVLDPDDVTVWEDTESGDPRYRVGNVELVRGRDIVHIPLNAWPGSVVGVGPLTAARLSMQGAWALEEYARKFFTDAAVPSGLLMVPSELSSSEAASLKAQWIASHSGKREPAVLSGGIEFKPLTLSPEDSQFVETREFAVADIARLFGIPGALLGTSTGDSLTYSTTESLLNWWIATTIRPTYLERIEQAFSELLPRTLDCRFDTRYLLRADTQTRFDAYATAIAAGVMTVNEARAFETLPPLPGGDVGVRTSTAREVVQSDDVEAADA